MRANPSHLRAAPLSRTLLSGLLAAQAAPALAAEAGAAQNSAPAHYPVASNGEAGAVNGYALSRWAEDWSAMRDPARRDDPLDRLKALPITADGQIYVTFSGELRLRVNHTTNPNLRDARAQRQDIDRLMGGADLHVGSHFRFYGELGHAGLGGVELGAPSGYWRNKMIVLQSFAEASDRIAGLDVGVRYGRQEFTDGPNLLVSQRDNNTIHYTLNGWRAWARGATHRVDVFDFKPTAVGSEGTGDDVSDPQRRFSGVTVGNVLPSGFLGGSKLTLDGFFWRRRNLVGTWGGRIGPATRFYGGFALRGDVGRVTLDWSANHQWGHYMDQGIDAWQVFLAQSVRLGHSKDAPAIGLQADYASGGGGYGQGKLRDAFSPFGNNVYFSYQLYLTPTNLVALAPTFAFSPARHVRVNAEYQLAWRDNVTDAVYRANGQPFAGTGNFHARRIANSTRGQIVWQVSPRVTLTGRYEHLAAGPALTMAGYKSSDYMSGWASLRF
ncbi:alginate export family protein [Novosphingobium pituita]|uniref:Alginate export family protein n=1 Tax=Novosphingobium pituita TaxID=3056842 RepID=A0ABQ6P4Q1_9SPHN|nr:alginate export family protein [Novosphingobium sp. IK01]GMM60205.1 alginate export family protein [Novosphingobium sp. IK01]